jgi:hypothetical protein
MKFTAMVLLSMSCAPHPRVPQHAQLTTGEGEALIGKYPLRLPSPPPLLTFL